MRSKILTAAGLLLFIAALGALLLSGQTEVRTSADAEATPVPLAAVVVPLLVGILLIRLVPPRLPVLEPAPAGERPALVRQAWALVAIAVLFPVLVLVVGRGGWYIALKLALLLGAALLVLRIWRAPSPTPAHRDALPVRWRWIGPVPAVLAWAYLLYYSPLAADVDLSGYRRYDREFLLAAMLVTFVSASVTEELFYRVMLQTRLEALLGRWPAIVATALLFAAMHVHRLGDGQAWLTVAVVLVWNGGFGLFVGYLWARYRNVWALIVTHGAVNSLTLLPMMLE